MMRIPAIKAMISRFTYLGVAAGALLFLQACTAQSRLVTGSQQTTVDETLHYYLYYPPGYDDSGSERYPLLLFLHGGGESGQNLEALRAGGPPKMLAEGHEFPFLILAPQNPHEKQWWNVRAVKQLLDSIVQANRVDPSRLYLTGLSRGGSASWEMAVQYPETFAAMAVVCGMAPVPYASWIDKQLAIWVFHGTDDPVIPFSESEAMVARLCALGYNVTFTPFEGVGHNSWERAYNTEGLFEWFTRHRRENP